MQSEHGPIDDGPEPGPHAANPTLTGRLWARPQRTRLYASGRSSPRSRRPTDLVLLELCAAGVVALGELSEPPSAFEQALIDVALAAPSFLDVVWDVGVALLSLWGLFLVFASLVRWRMDILRDEVLGILGALVIVTVVTDLIAEGTVELWSSLTAAGPPADPVSLRLAMVSAVTVVASPHITRPFRTTSRWLVSLGAVSLVLLEATTPSGAALGVLCGAIAGTAVHLLVGSTGGRPSLEAVGRGLEELGVEVTLLSEGRRQRAGVFVLDATDPTGRPLVVRVYGRDAWDAQLLAKAWRALWYRDAGALTLTRVQQAEHEAFAALLAARDGVPVHRVVRAGRTTGGDALIVLQVVGVPLDGHEIDDALLDSMWHTVLALTAAGFGHGDLAPEVFRVDEGDVVVDGLAAVVPDRHVLVLVAGHAAPRDRRAGRTLDHRDPGPTTSPRDLTGGSDCSNTLSAAVTSMIPPAASAGLRVSRVNRHVEMHGGSNGGRVRAPQGRHRRTQERPRTQQRVPARRTPQRSR